MWHDPQQLKHVYPEALGSPSGYVVPTGHRLLRPHAHSESLPAAYGFAAGAAAPKENGLRWESRGSPIYSAGLCSRAASHTPATRRVRLTVSSSSVLAFTPVSRVRHTLEVSRLQSSLIPTSTGIVTARELASPPFEDVYIRACPARSPSISVEYDYVDKQSIPTAGLSPASPTALWAAGHRISPRRLLSQLEDIREVINLYPKRRKAAKMRQQTVLTRMSKVQKRLVVILGLERKGEGELG